MNSLPPPPPPPYPPPSSSRTYLENIVEDAFAGTSCDYSSVKSQYTASVAQEAKVHVGLSGPLHGAKFVVANDSFSTIASTENQFFVRSDVAVILREETNTTGNTNNKILSSTEGKENNLPKKFEKNWLSGKKSKTLPSDTNAEQRERGSGSTFHMWKMKKKQHSHRRNKAKTSSAAAAVLEERNLASPTSNFFTQMGDDEVGNHNNSDVHTMVTEPTASISSNSKSTAPSSVGEGFRFQPHASAGDTDEDYHYLAPQATPIRAGWTELKTSPQSVMEGVDKQVTLTAFPRYAKDGKCGMKVSKHLYHVGRFINRHDSSYDDSDIDVIDELEEGDDDASVGTSIAKAISDSLPPVLNILHDFIIGSPCSSEGGNLSTFMNGLSTRCIGEGATAACNDGNNVRDDDDDDEEERSANSHDEHSYTSNDDDDASFYTSDTSSRYGGTKGGAKKKRPKTAAAARKKHGVPQTKKHVTRSQRRGRSPTIKEGYNSDGESLRSRSRCSRGSISQSTSRDDSTIDRSVSSHYQVDVTVMDPLVKTHDERGGDGCASLSPASVEFSLGEDVELKHDRNGVLSRNRGESVNSILDASDRRGNARIHFAAANETAGDASSGTGIDACDSIVSTVAADLLSYDKAMWMCMTQDKSPSLIGQVVDTTDGDGGGGGNNILFKGSSAIEGYFKKILTVGIQLILNDPPSSSHGPRLHRNGKMYLKFGPHSREGAYECPSLLWTDGHDISHTIEVFDIESIHQPTESELIDTYPFAIPTQCFFISTKSNCLSLLFEAVDELQVERITTALRGIIARLARKVVSGESDWVGQMMLVSSSQAAKFEEVEEMVPCAITDMSDNLVKKSSFAIPDVSDYMEKKTAWIKQARARRTRLLNRRVKKA